jgi:hypothetical protein
MGRTGGVRFPARTRDFSPHHIVHTGSGVHTASYPVGTGNFSRGIKRGGGGREADPSPPTSAEVKKTWNYTSTPPYTFMAWCLIN